MARYEVTAPNGNKYQVTAPEGASLAELREYVKRNHPNSQSNGAVGKNYGKDYEYQSEDTNFLEDVADVGVGVASGLYRAAGSVVGLGSYVKGLNELADPIASWLHRAGDTIDEGLLSARQKELNREISTRLQNVITTLPEEAELGDYYDAMLEGGGEAGDFLWNHKAQVFNLIAQSVPYMLGGGAITKGLNFGLKKFGAKPLGQIVGAGVGEGMIVGGDLVTQHIAETDSVGEYDADRLKLLPAIASTAGISMLGGRIAKGLKIADPDVAITGKVAYGKDLLSNKHMAGGLVRRTGLGVAVESGEEFLQEGTEQMWGNVAAGRHPLVGVGGPAVMGAAAGGGQGGGINLLGAAADIRSKKDAQKKLNTGIDESLDGIRQQKEQEKQEDFIEAKEQQDLFNSNEDILKNVLNLVGIDNLNIAENIPGADPETVNSLESPLDQALYYLQKLKEAPYQTFESDDGRSKTNSENLIKSFEKHIESMAPGHLAVEEEADLIQAENESRRKHKATFPNEKEWDKIVAGEEFERLRIEISSPDTELGKLFIEWLDAPDIDIKYMHDTDANGLPTEGAIKLFIKDHPDLFPKGAIGTYVEALTEHARLEENRLTRSQIDKNYLAEEIAKLVARRTQALADGNLQELRTIEEEVARRQSSIFSAEWLEAKRAIAVVKPKKTTDVAKEVVIPGEAPVTTTLVGQVDDAGEDTLEQGQLNLGGQEEAKSKLLRYKEGSQRQANHEKAVTEFGENYENEWFGPKVVAAIKKGGEKSFANFVEHQSFKVTQWKMANALEDSELRALNQIPLKGTWQQAVVPFLVDAVNRDRLEDYGTYKSNLSKTPDPAEIKKRVRGVDYELDHKSLTEAEKKKLNFVSKAKKPSTLSDIIESINKKRKVEKRPLLEPKTKFTINELKKPEEKTEEGEEQEGHNFTFFNQIIAAELKELGITGTEELKERDAGKRINDALVAYRKNQIKFGESEQAEKVLYDKLAPKGNDTAALRKENKRRKAAGDPPLVSRKFRELIETFFERTQEKVDLERSSSTASVSQLEPDTGAKPAITQVEDEGVALKGEIDAADELARLKTAGAAQIKIDALSEEEKEYVAEKSKLADSVYLKRVADLKKESIKRVNKANKNKKFFATLKSEWTIQNDGDAKKGEVVYLPYDQQPIEVQEAWIWSVNKANSQRDRRQFLLAREFVDTIKAHSETIKKLGDKAYDKTDSIREIESAKVAERERKAAETKSRPRIADDKKSAAGIEQIFSKKQIKKLKDRPIVKMENGKYVNIPLALRRHIDSIEDGRALWEYSTGELVLQAKIAIVNMEQDTLDPKTWKKLKGSDLNKFNSLKDFINKWQEKKGGDAPDDSDFRLNVTDIHAVDEVLETLQATPADMEAMFHKLIGRKFYKKLYDQGKISYYKTAAEAVEDINKDRPNKVAEGRLNDAGAFVEINADGTLSRIAFVLGHIHKDDAASVFMHEVGGHIGLEGVLGPKGVAVLAREIRGWARGIPPVGSTSYKRTAMSKEKLAAQANARVEIHKRVAKRHGEPLTQEDIDSETIAYFVQGASKAGVKPTDVTAAGKILKRFRDAFLKFMQLARLAKQGNYKSSEKPNITAQNIVDMAWGGAKLELRPSLGYIWKTFRSGSRYLGTTTARNLIEKAYREDLVAPVRFKAVKHDLIGMEDPVDPRSKKRRKLEEELRKLQAVKPSNMTQAKLERKLQLEDEFRLMEYQWERHKIAEGSRARIDDLNKEIWALDAKKRERRASNKKTFSESIKSDEFQDLAKLFSEISLAAQNKADAYEHLKKVASSPVGRRLFLEERRRRHEEVRKRQVELKNKRTATRESFDDMFRNILGQKQYNKLKGRPGRNLKNKITYYKTTDDARRYEDPNMPDDAYGGVSKGPDGTVDGIFFILDGVLKGTEEETFMHEIGVHVGMAGILGEKGVKTIADRIWQWKWEDISSIREMPGFNGASMEDLMNPEKFPAKSKEHLIARQSTPDLMHGTSSEGYLDNEGNEIESKVNEEVIAYFLQHAVRSGIKLSHTTVIGRILQKFRNAFRDFMGYAKEETDNLTAQSLADMAIGAARIQMGSNVALDPATKKLLLQARREGLTEESTDESELYARSPAEIEQLLSAQKNNKKSQLDAGVISKEEYDLSIKDINYKIENPDLFEDTGVYYHGTSEPIEQLGYAPGTFNIYGDGLYTTMNKGTAYRYTKKGKGKNPTLYRVIEKNPGPSLNIETTPAIQFGKGILSDFFTDKELKSMSLREAIDEFRNRSADEMYPAHEVIDLIANIFDNAYDRGFKSVTHYGGRLSDGTRHRVKIFTHPANDVDLVENSIFWEQKIEDKIRREVPKNDKGKYITEAGAYLSRDDWIQFQKDQWAKEKRLRAKYKEQVDEMMKDAAQHEEDMGGPDGTLYARRSTLNDDEKKRNKDEADRIENHVEKNFNADMKGMWTTMKDIAKKGGRKLEFLHEQIHRNRKAMPGGVEFGEGILKGEQLRNEIKKTADDIAVQARNLSSARLYVVNQTIAFGTIEQLWPADPNTKDVSVAKGNVTIDKDFQKVFEEKLSTEEQKIVMDVYRHGIDLLEEKRIRTEAALGKDASHALFRISELKGPYAPLRRTGSHTVVLKSKEYLAAEEKMADIKKVKSKTKQKIIEKQFNKLKGNKNHYVYTHFLTQGEAEKFADKEERTGNWAPRVKSAKETGIRYQEKPEAIGAGREPDIKVLQKVYGALSTSELKDDPKTREMVEAMLKDLFIESLEETNARQSMAKREGIHGYDENMLRSFVTNAKSEANLIANLAHGKEINVALSNAFKEAHAHDDENTIKLYRELVFHYNLMLNQKDTNIQDSVASFTTAWVLTMSPTYHLQNMTQPWAVSYPILAAVFNDWMGVTPRMAEGYNIARSIISYDGKVPFLSMKKVTWQTNVDVDNVPTWVDAKGISKEERARRLDMWVKTIKPLLQRLQSGNLLDLGIEQDLSDNVNMKTTGYDMYDATTKFAGKASHRLYQVPRMVEAYNRVATAIAAHEMAQANPKVMDQMETTPEDFAVRIVRRTQGDFTASGAPGAIKWLLSKTGGKLFAQFQKFRFLMIANYVYAYREAFHGATPVEKAVGRRALTYLIAHTTVLSGVRGLPFIGGGVGGYSLVHAYFWLMSALPFFGGEPEDEEILTEGLLERKIMESFPDNPEFAKAITRGLPYLLGIDTSMKLSHAGIFDPTPFTEWELSTQGFYELGYTIFGASGSNALNIARGAEFMKEGNYYRGVESMMPKGIRSVMESGRLATEGYSLRGGKVVASPDYFSTKALMLNALGVPTREVGNLKWTRSEQYQIEEYFTKAQAQLRRDYINANNKKEREEVREKWKVLQKRKDGLRPFFNNSRKALKRTPITSLHRAPSEKEKSEAQYKRELNTI